MEVNLDSSHATGSELAYCSCAYILAQTRMKDEYPRQMFAIWFNAHARRTELWILWHSSYKQNLKCVFDCLGSKTQPSDLSKLSLVPHICCHMELRICGYYPCCFFQLKLKWIENDYIPAGTLNWVGYGLWSRQEIEPWFLARYWRELDDACGAEIQENQFRRKDHCRSGFDQGRTCSSI